MKNYYQDNNAYKGQLFQGLSKRPFPCIELGLGRLEITINGVTYSIDGVKPIQAPK